MGGAFVRVVFYLYSWLLEGFLVSFSVFVGCFAIFVWWFLGRIAKVLECFTVLFEGLKGLLKGFLERFWSL